MIPDATTTSTPAPQVAAPGPQPPPAPPAPQPTPVQLFWEVARMAFVLMTRLIQVLQPIQSYYLNQSRQIMRVCTEVCRVMLTIRFAPERITQTQLRHLTRARHLLQALFNYTLPTTLGTPISRLASASPTANQSPSASTENATPLGPRTSSSATTPSPAVAAVPEVPEVPEVPAVPGGSSSRTPSAASSKAPAASTPAPSHPSPTSHDSHPSQASPSPHSAFRIQHSAFSPYIPDANTLVAAVRAATLPPNCAGALLEDPGEALVRALHELHAVYFSLYPNQPPTPTPVQSPSPSPSQSPSSGNLQSSICNLQSGNPQSDASSVHPANAVNPVHPVHPASPVQSEISNLKPENPNLQSAICNPQSDAPP